MSDDRESGDDRSACRRKTAASTPSHYFRLRARLAAIPAARAAAPTATAAAASFAPFAFFFRRVTLPAALVAIAFALFPARATRAARSIHRPNTRSGGKAKGWDASCGTVPRCGR